MTAAPAPVVRCRAEGCGRRLTDGDSQTLGYGPVCAARLGIGYVAPKAARTASTRQAHHDLGVSPEQMALTLEAS
jgi:hypothetical protein